MTSLDRSDRSLPTFITLVVLAILLMTFDIRRQEKGRADGARQTPALLQRGAVIDPVADFIDGL